MGFDYDIHAILYICSDTGKLFYYGDNFVKVYDFPPIIVPEEYRRFINGHKTIFFAYTHYFNENYIRCADISDFLTNFPTWSTVTLWKYMNDWNDEGWAEEDHNLFLEALKWFSEQKIGYEICWSY